jgi:hypothetical protein
LATIKCKLAAQHGYAPVEITIDRTYDNRSLIVFATERLREVHHPFLNKSIWVPAEMTKGDEVRVTLEGITINPSIAPSEFLPPSPDPGAKLIDDTDPSKRKVTIHAPEEVRAQIMEAATVVSPRAPRTVIASPRGDAIDWKWWLLTPVILCGAALALYSRR